MKVYSQEIRRKIKELRLERKLKQSELDEAADLTPTSITKIEAGRREVAAKEIIPLARALGVTPEFLLGSRSGVIYNEEKHIIEALRVIPFKDYKQIISRLEAAVYFTSKNKRGKPKNRLLDLTESLSKLTTEDVRPRQ